MRTTVTLILNYIKNINDFVGAKLNIPYLVSFVYVLVECGINGKKKKRMDFVYLKLSVKIMKFK